MLMKLKLYKAADAELRQFEHFNRQLYFYETHAQYYGTQRRGCMVPFGLRVLDAELPYYMLRGDESIAHLQRLVDTIKSQILPQFKNNKSE